MQPIRPFFTDFTKGEISPRLEGRIDLQDYIRSCRTLQNMVLHPSGGVDRRPGTYYCGETKNTNQVRLIPFVAASGNAYVLEFSNLIMRVWKDGALVQSGGTPMEVTSPYAAADLFGLKYAQTEGSMVFAHPNYLLYELIYGGSDANWQFVNEATSPLVVMLHLGTTPYMSMYTGYGDAFTEVPIPGTLKVEGDALMFSPDGITLAYAGYNIPDGQFLDFYTRVGNNAFTGPVGADFPPDGIASWLAFTRDGNYLAAALASTPWLNWWKRTASGWTKMPQPPSGVGNTAKNGASWSPDGILLATCNSNSPSVQIFKRTGDTIAWLKALNECTDTGQGVAFSPDGLHLACSFNATPYIRIYRVDGETFTLLPGPDTSIGLNAQTLRYDPSGTYLVQCAGGGSPWMAWYKRDGDQYTKLANPATLPDGQTNDVCWSGDGKYLVFAHWTGSYITIYKRTGDTLTKLTDPTVPEDITIRTSWSNTGFTHRPWLPDKVAALTFHEQRLVLGGKNTIWASYSGNMHDFRQDAVDDSSGYEYQFASDVLEDIVWMATKQHNILIGTTFGEWLMTGGNAPISGSNVYIERISAFGSGNIAAILANESILYVQKGLQRLREFLYSNERGGYLSPDLMYLADHFGSKGFKQLAWQRSPRPVLWCVMNDGSLIALTLDRNHNIQGWHGHATDGLVDSIAIIPGSVEDIIYLTTIRVINGTTKKYVEFMKPLDWGSNQRDCFFVDCGKTVDHSATTDTITGATQAKPIVITAGAHPFANDDKVKIVGVGGMTGLNGKVFTVKNKAADTFQLYDEAGANPVDGTEGTVELAANPAEGAFDPNKVDIAGLSSGAIGDILSVISAKKYLVRGLLGTFTAGESIAGNECFHGTCEETDEPMLDNETVPVKSGCTWARDAAQAKYGSYSYKLTKTVAAGTVAWASLCENQLSTDLHGMVTGKAYKAIIWVYIPTASGILDSEVEFGLDYYDGGWSSHDTSATGLGYDAWVKLELNFTLSGTTTGAYFKIRTNQTAAVNEYYYVDSVIVTHNISTGAAGYPIKIDTYGAYTSGGTATKVVKSVSSLGHLEAKTVHILADGGAHPTKTVSSGAITLDRYASTIHVGLGYSPIIKPQRLRENITMTKRIDHLLLRFYKTLGVWAGPDMANLEEVLFRATGDPMDTPPALYTGDKEVSFRGGFDRDGSIIITQTQPLPLSLLAIFADAMVTG